MPTRDYPSSPAHPAFSTPCQGACPHLDLCRRAGCQGWAEALGARPSPSFGSLGGSAPQIGPLAGGFHPEHRMSDSPPASPAPVPAPGPAQQPQLLAAQPSPAPAAPLQAQAAPVGDLVIRRVRNGWIVTAGPGETWVATGPLDLAGVVERWAGAPPR